jgi:hypothetical protein
MPGGNISTAKRYRGDVIKDHINTIHIHVALENSKILHYFTFGELEMLKPCNRE